MPIPLLAAAAISAIPSIFQGIEGIGQRRQAKRLRKNAVNPGFEMNSGIMQNAETLQNRYNNYSLPGYSMQMNRLGSNAATAFDRGAQGASSSADVLDLATKIAYGTGQQQNQLMLQNAQGKEGALSDYLNANAAAGDQRQQSNAWDRQQYMQQLQEAAALYGAGGQNMNNAITGIGSIGASMLMNQPNKGPHERNARIGSAGMAGVSNTAGQLGGAPINPFAPSLGGAKSVGITNTVGGLLPTYLGGSGRTGVTNTMGGLNTKPIIPFPKY